MANGSENIEARLAAYIEGDLPESERAGIEQYLAQNPSHRQLIEELRGQKRHLASLPRERAPAEVLDHLQSHLERQSLLENVEESAASMHINRWPQWTAVAAMLLLTVGLGYLVVQVLPGGDLNREQVAIAPSSVQQLPEVPTLNEDLKSDRAVLDAAKRDNDSEARASKGGDPVPAGETADAAAPGRRGDDFVDKIAAEMSKKSMGELEALALNNGSAIVVSTDDPLITQNLLAGYLGQKELAFKPVQPEVAVNLKDVPVELKLKQQFNQAPDQQQAIGSVVEKVKQRDVEQRAVDAHPEQKLALKSEEAYLVVKNVSTEQAQSINRLLNEQRIGRQQAKFYSNGDLYPELQQQRQQQTQAATQNADDALREGQQVGKSIGKIAGTQDQSPAAGGMNAMPTQGNVTQSNTTDNKALSNNAAAAEATTAEQAAANQQAQNSAITVAPPSSTTQPAEAKQEAAPTYPVVVPMAADLTDVLIVVRSEPSVLQTDGDHERTSAKPAPTTREAAPTVDVPAPTTVPSTQPVPPAPAE